MHLDYTLFKIENSMLLMGRFSFNATKYYIISINRTKSPIRWTIVSLNKCRTIHTSVSLLVIISSSLYILTLFKIDLRIYPTKSSIQFQAKSRKYRGIFHVKSRVKTRQVRTRHVFVKHGCPRWQQSQNMAKISMSYILTRPTPRGR